MRNAAGDWRAANQRLSAGTGRVTGPDLDLLRRAVGTPSVTGAERGLALLLAEECRALGLAPMVEDFLPGRPNVWAHRRSDGDGPCLLIVGHTDTVHVKGWSERWAGTEREDPHAAAVIADEVWGRGAAAYFGVPERGADALKAAHKVLSALCAHSAALEAGAAHGLIGRSFLLVTGIEGGGLIAVPGQVRLSLILKLRPGDDLEAARAALEAAALDPVAAPDIAIAFAYPAGRDHPVGELPCETDPAHPAIGRLAAALIASPSCAVQVCPGLSEAPLKPHWFC